MKEREGGRKEGKVGGRGKQRWGSLRKSGRGRGSMGKKEEKEGEKGGEGKDKDVDKGGLRPPMPCTCMVAI